MFSLGPGCVCINPFLGEYRDVQVNGDPDAMCKKKNMCYVDCNSSCRDVQNAKGIGRCYSKKACEDRRNNGVYPYPGYNGHYPPIWTVYPGHTTPYWWKTSTGNPAPSGNSKELENHLTLAHNIFTHIVLGVLVGRLACL